MKPPKCSFLFFYSGLMAALLMLPASSYGQAANDSLYHYYNAILDPQNAADLPRGIAFYTRQTNRALELNDTLHALESLRMMAIGQFKIGDLYDSEETVVQALGLINQNTHKDTLIDAQVGLNNQLGRIYGSLQNYPEARLAFAEALKITPRAKDSITILNNLANLYFESAQYNNALEEYTAAYRIQGIQNDSLLLAMVLDNIGATLARQKAPGALDSLMKALKIRERQRDLSGLYASYKSLARYYLDEANEATAMDYAQKAFHTAEQLNSAAFRYDALELLLGLKKDGQVLEYLRLTDSISNAKQLADNKNAFIKYNLNEERKKTAQQELEKERQKRSKQLFQVSTVFILLLLVLSYFVFRYRYKKGKQEAMYKTESRIAKKVHDELANDIFNAMAYAESNDLKKGADKEYLLTSLDRLYGKSRDISRNHAPIETGAAYSQALHELLSNYGTEKTNVLVKGLSKISWEQVDEYKKIACYRVLQELMTNMKKHSRASLVLVEFAQDTRSLTISYTDNGVGIARDASIRFGGLGNAENRIVANKGTVTFEPGANKGFQYSFSFPV